MEITLNRSAAQRKNPRLVIFNIEGRPGSVQFFRALFPKDAVPTTLHLTGEFAPPKVKETAEERKARRAALPKLTPAERLVRMEARLARMKAELATAPSAPTKAGGASSGTVYNREGNPVRVTVPEKAKAQKKGAR